VTNTAEDTTQEAPPRRETAKSPWWLRHYTFTGTALGLVFIWFSLTPSLLPRGPLFRQILGNLRVYKGAEHPHAAQSPEALDVAALNSKNARV